MKFQVKIYITSTVLGLLFVICFLMTVNIIDLDKKYNKALLDLLLEKSEGGKILSDEDIQDEVNTFMFAVNLTFLIHSNSLVL